MKKEENTNQNNVGARLAPALLNGHCIRISIILLLLMTFTVLRVEAQGLKAIQLLFSPVEKRSQLDTFFHKTRQAGIDSVIIRLFSLPGDRDFWRRKGEENFSGVYYKTKHAPWKDIYLPEIIKSAKKFGVKVFGWMTTRKSVWALEQHPEWADVYYDINKKKYRYHVDRLDIFNPAVCNYLSKLLKDVPENGLDGLLFQDDLVIRYNEGFTKSGINGYHEFNESDVGIMPKDLFKEISFCKEDNRNYVTKFTKEYYKWQEWKNLYLISLLNTFSDEMKSKNEYFKVIYNCYYETIVMPDKAIEWLSQDISSMQKYLNVDHISIMLYHIQMERELKKNFEDIKKMVDTGLKNNIQSSKVVIKIQLKDWKTRKCESSDKIEQIVKLLKKNNINSFIFVPIDNVKDMELVRVALNVLNRKG
ncbi:hypothetical protein KAJ27_11905 [bacterium]|nr:hypothetical protein [bacterium]